MSEGLIFSEKEWDAAKPKVVAAMVDHLCSYRTAIYEHKNDYGDGWGSGAFLKLGHKVYIITNQHVACIRSAARGLAYKFNGQEDIRLVIGDHVEFPFPLDLALLPIDMNAWNNTLHSSKAIEIEQISIGHDPVPGELLTFTGFSGENVHFHFNTLFAKATCYTATETKIEVDDQFTRYHFGIDYRPDLASNVVDNKPLPTPPGLSGSVLWDTRFVAAKTAGIQWTAEMAQVTGVIWGWSSNQAHLIATRAEYLRSFLLAVK